ncbi:MAG: NAD(P)/FAD-dependent oxidoreductase [Brooklawnia sp.]|uniref:dihydrolipoyl dehydrogenase family protein n=1 Tax=Brooklawnia sp. TaxID=2699740 RepID=UPI003C7718FD
MDGTYDFIVVGGGPVGEVAAQYAINGTDLTAVIIESHLLGGSCSYYACMPSKALLHPLDVVGASANLQGLRPASVDRDQLLARRDQWVSNYDDAEQVEWADGEGIELVRGRGRLGDGERTVEVDGRTLTARQAVIIATGSHPTIPELLQPLNPWDNRDATGVVEVPDRLAIVGGGVVAVEAARWMAALGSQVTLLVRSRLLGRFEPFVGELVTEGLRADDVEVRLDTEVTDAERADVRDTGLGRLHGGQLTLRTSKGDQLRVDEVLAATGRKPNLDGVELDPRPEWLHYVGDAAGEAPLTHWGKYRARLLGERLQARALGRPAPEFPDDVPVPQVIFSSPQVATVGLTLDKAQGRWPDTSAVDVDMSAVSGVSLLRDDAAGKARLVVRPDGVLCGASFVGPGVAELLHSATVAITAGLTIDQLRHAVPSYPTASEVWLQLVEKCHQL